MRLSDPVHSCIVAPFHLLDRCSSPDDDAVNDYGLDSDNAKVHGLVVLVNSIKELSVLLQLATRDVRGKVRIMTTGDVV